MASVIIDNVAAGIPRTEILSGYPSIKSEDIDAALVYAAELAREGSVDVDRRWEPNPLSTRELIATPAIDSFQTTNAESRLLSAKTANFGDSFFEFSHPAQNKPQTPVFPISPTPPRRPSRATLRMGEGADSRRKASGWHGSIPEAPHG